MTHMVKKHQDGNWSINGYLLGIDKDFVDHMTQDNGWTIADFIEHLMINVASALNTRVTQERPPFSTCQYGTSFQYDGCDIDVIISDQGTILDIDTGDVMSHEIPVVMIKRFTHQLELEVEGKRSYIWTDHDEEPSTNVYLATSPNWQGARLITNTPDLVATVNDKSVVSLVRVSLELSLQ